MNTKQLKAGAIITLVILSLITIFGLALNFHKFIPPEIQMDDTIKIKQPKVRDTQPQPFGALNEGNTHGSNTTLIGFEDPPYRWHTVGGEEIVSYPPDSTPSKLKAEIVGLDPNRTYNIKITIKERDGHVESIRPETDFELANRVCWKKVKVPGKGKWWLVDVTDGYHRIWFDTMANYRLEDQQGFTVIKSFAWPGCWEKEPNPDSLDSYIKRSNRLWLAFNPKKEGKP